MRRPLRFSALAGLIALSFLLVLPWKPAIAAGPKSDHVVLILGGDVEWSLNSGPPTVRYPIADRRPYGLLVFANKRDVRDQIVSDWPPVPYVNEGEIAAYLKSLGLKGGSNDSFGASLSYPLEGGPEYTQDYSSNEELLNYPLRR